VRSLKNFDPSRSEFEKSGVKIEEFHRFRRLFLKSREEEESGRDGGISKKIC
jgi:hypothetical protein